MQAPTPTRTHADKTANALTHAHARTHARRHSHERAHARTHTNSHARRQAAKHAHARTRPHAGTTTSMRTHARTHAHARRWLGAAKQKTVESPSIPTSVLHEYNNFMYGIGGPCGANDGGVGYTPPGGYGRCMRIRLAAAVAAVTWIRLAVAGTCARRTRRAAGSPMTCSARCHLPVAKPSVGQSVAAGPAQASQA
jgi:hypothetical protein